MKKGKNERPSHQLWAEFRFGVVGSLASSPPAGGELQQRLKELAEKKWNHPIRGEDFHLSVSTIERWYYKLLKNDNNPVENLRRKIRTDFGKNRLSIDVIKDWLRVSYRDHPSWSGKLHFDNFKAWLIENPQIEALPSYSTVMRYMRLRNWNRKARVRSPNAPGRAAAMLRLDEREVRSYEIEYVGGLWHLDFHHASRQIQTEKGELVTPIALCVIDDHSRLVCHIQWFFRETTQCLVHGFIQSIQKRGLPRATMLDNGAAMISAEFKQGCSRIGIILEPTLPYSPYQNGKQESYWGTLEGRLMAMIENKKNLSLEELNLATQAWVEHEYNRSVHSETKQSPIDRFLNGKSVLRISPDFKTLQLAFRREETRTQRQTDGTISISGKRFEIPSAYRTLKRITVHFAKWDLRLIHLVDPKTQQCLLPLYPLDKAKNAEGLRKKYATIESDTDGKKKSEMGEGNNGIKDDYSDLMKKLLAEYSASGLPPAYIADPID